MFFVCVILEIEKQLIWQNQYSAISVGHFRIKSVRHFKYLPVKIWKGWWSSSLATAIIQWNTLGNNMLSLLDSRGHHLMCCHDDIASCSCPRHALRLFMFYFCVRRSKSDFDMLLKSVLQILFPFQMSFVLQKSISQKLYNGAWLVHTCISAPGH